MLEILNTQHSALDRSPLQVGYHLAAIGAEALIVDRLQNLNQDIAINDIAHQLSALIKGTLAGTSPASHP